MSGCSACGNCCRYLVFTLTKPTMSLFNQNNKKTITIYTPGTYTEDEIRYYSLHNVKVINGNPTQLILPNIYPRRNRLEKKDEKSKLWIVYCPCSMLQSDNKCRIFQSRPDVCDYSKCKLDVWFPSSCTDKEMKINKKEEIWYERRNK